MHELAETGHFTSANIFITPPSYGELSDEDSDDAEGGSGTMDNLTSKRLLADAVATTSIGITRHNIVNVMTALTQMIIFLRNV